MTKTKEKKTQNQQKLDFIEFYKDGVTYSFKISGRIGVRKADRDGKFILLECEEKDILIGMSKRNPQNPWAAKRQKEEIRESNFIDLNRAIALPLEGEYAISKSYNPSSEKGWIHLKNMNSEEEYIISTQKDGSRLTIREENKPSEADIQEI